MPNLLVNIDVDNLAKAEAFYTQAFGLRPTRRFGNDGVELIGLGAPIYLLVKQSSTPAARTTDQRRDYRRHWTPVHLDIVVEDIDAAIARAQTAGATLEAPVKSSNWGKLALMADPLATGSA